MRNRTYNRLAILLITLCIFATGFTAYSTYRLHRDIHKHLLLEMAKVEQMYDINAALDQQNRIMHQMHIESLSKVPKLLKEENPLY